MRYRRVAPRWVCFLFVAVGMFVLLLSLGVVPYVPMGRRRGLLDGPEHWQITSLGVSFIAAGVLMAFPRAKTSLRLAIGLPAVVGLLAPLGWVVFASSLTLGDRVLLGLPLAIGVLGAGLGVYQALTGWPFDPASLDPLEAARILRHHGRHEQAEALLRRAMQEEPARREQWRRAIDAMRRRRGVR